MHRSIFNLDIQGIHAWRQSATMWNVKNFARHDANILNPRLSKWNTITNDNIVRLEFPILQWSIAMVYKTLGERIIFMRLIMFGIGLFSAFGLFRIINYETKNILAAGLTASLVQFSPLFYYYNINPLPDLLAMCMSIWYIYFIRRHRVEGKSKHLLFAGFFIMMACLAKLPYLMFSIISVYYFLVDIIRKSDKKSAFTTAAYLLMFLIAPICWYSWVMQSWSTGGALSGVFEKGLFTPKNWEIFLHHIYDVFPYRLLSWPVYPILFMGFIYIWRKRKEQSWMWSIIFIVLIYFIFQLSTINIQHDYYIIPFIPVVYLIIGFGVTYALEITSKNWIVIFGLIVFSAFYCKNEIDKDWSVARTYSNPDFFRYAKVLKEAVPRDDKCIIMRDLSCAIFSNQIDKQGHIFDVDTIPLGWVKDMILNKDVKYMYSDSEKMNALMDSSIFIDSMLMEKGSIKLYRFKKPEILLPLVNQED